MIEGRYIYCISGKNNESGAETLGLMQRPVYFLSYKDIGAYVSKIPFDDIKTDIESIEVHQRVVEFSRLRSATLPVKFGVIFKTEDGVRSMLSKSYDDYMSKLIRFQNKDEFGVKVLIRNQGSRQNGQTQNRAKLKNRSKALGEGALYFQKLREEETRRSDELRKWDALRATIREELAKHSDQQASLNSDLPQILLNSAYLVDRHRRAVFESNVDDIRMRFEPQGLTIHLSGPWAPYSFC